MMRKLRLTSNKTSLFILSILASILVSSSVSLATESLVTEEAPAAMTPGDKEIVLITKNGFSPNKISVEQSSSLFFLNATNSSKFHISLTLNKSELHCWTKNLQRNDDGTLSSVEPVGPKDFSLLCFPTKGEFEVQVKGVGDFNKSFSTFVEVR